jgi:hypothetical protein
VLNDPRRYAPENLTEEAVDQNIEKAPLKKILRLKEMRIRGK